MKFLNLPEEYLKIVEMLGKKISLDTIDVEVKYSPSEQIVVSFDGVYGEIKCLKKHHFCRALTLFAMNYKKSGGGSFRKTEREAFEMLGCMLDLSFSTVLTMDSIKDFIDYIALFGFNTLLLNMEDMYMIPGRPFFGYMRGGFTYNELKELDDYGFVYGIEIIPKIQTLGHLSAYLQWPEAAGVRENDQVLEPESDKTYELVEEMIANASAPFRTKRIHIGCDETHGLGMGTSFKKHGYRSPLKLLVEHVNRAAEICKKYGLKPMIAGDMYIAFSSDRYCNYDTEAVISDEVKAIVNKEVDYVFWHYGQLPGCEEALIDKYVELNGRAPLFLGGVRIYHNPLTDNIFSTLATQTSLPACKAKGVKAAINSIWCYHFAFYFTALLDLARYGEFGYNDTDDGTKDTFEFVTGASYDAFMMMSNFSCPYETKEQRASASYWADSIGYKLYQCDIMQNIMEKDMIDFKLSDYYKRNAGWVKKVSDEEAAKWDTMYEGLRLSDFYRRGADWFKPLADSNDAQWDFLYKYCYHAFDAMAYKCEIVDKLRSAYEKGERETLKIIADELLPKYISAMESSRDYNMYYKDKYLKPFGAGTTEADYGRHLERARGAIRRINKYLSGELSRLEELEVEKLKYPLGGPVVFAR